MENINLGNNLELVRSSKKIIKKLDDTSYHESTGLLSNSEMLILERLANSYPKVVSRSELLEQCWPGKVVSNSSLNVSICNIRTALNELNEEDFIVTIPRKGYCFNKHQNNSPKLERQILDDQSTTTVRLRDRKLRITISLSFLNCATILAGLLSIAVVAYIKLHLQL